MVMEAEKKNGAVALHSVVSKDVVFHKHARMVLLAANIVHLHKMVVSVG